VKVAAVVNKNLLKRIDDEYSRLVAGSGNQKLKAKSFSSPSG
jgi:hypothetical protein